jgi:hypothetical protein
MKRGFSCPQCRCQCNSHKVVHSTHNIGNGLHKEHKQTMKRSLNEITESVITTGCGIHTIIQEEDRAKKLLRSQSVTGFAAMTLMSLAVSACKARVSDASIPSMPAVDISPIDHSRVSSQSSDRGHDTGKKAETLTTASQQRGSYQEFVFECGALRDDWTALCKPLPLPPRLPSLPSGARASSRGNLMLMEKNCRIPSQ